MPEIDSDTIRTTVYLLVALLAFAAKSRERRFADADDDVLSWFWPLTGLLLLTLAIGRAADVAERVTELGRGQAIGAGWYRDRRGLQSWAVATLAVVWFVSVTAAVWRTPERRRRYLPMGVAVGSVMAYVAVRLVSLHQVDAVLYRTHVVGVRVGTIIELTLLGLAALATTWPWYARLHRTPTARPGA